jgi:hypothetical protein
MKKTSNVLSMALVSLYAVVTFTSCLKDETVDPPPYAASAQTWVIGGLTWSDAIQDPACNKSDYNGGTKDNPKADGRSYTYEGHTYYYYSWPYVNKHASRLCPSPWRVPTSADEQRVVRTGSNEELMEKWGLGGYVSNDRLEWVNKGGYYWSSTPSADFFAFSFHYWELSLTETIEYQRFGYQVRCVK